MSLLVLLSPAKTFNEKNPLPESFPVTTPHFYQHHTLAMVNKLRDYSVADLAKLLDISEKLAEANYERYQHFAEQLTAENSRPAGFTFWGDVNRNFDAYTLSKEDLSYANHHVFYLSGLYGLVRPLESIQTYRLEMGKPFAPTAKCSNLYSYWKPLLVEYVNELIKTEDYSLIVNLASKEYASAFDFSKANIPTVEIVFKEQRNGKYKVISVIAKRSRGLFARWIVTNKISTREQLQQFNVNGYYFNAKESTENIYVFYRDEEL